jgi:hypothetical protein
MQAKRKYARRYTFITYASQFAPDRIPEKWSIGQSHIPTMAVFPGKRSGNGNSRNTKYSTWHPKMVATSFLSRPPYFPNNHLHLQKYVISRVSGVFCRLYPNTPTNILQAEPVIAFQKLSCRKKTNKKVVDTYLPCLSVCQNATTRQ